MSKYILGVVLVLLIAGAAVWWLRSRGRPAIMPYGQLRGQMIRGMGRAEAARGEPPARPAGLDGRLGRAEYEALREAVSRRDGLHEYLEVIRSIFDEMQAVDAGEFWYECLSPGRRAVVLLDNLESEVNNGGFDQYYLNSSGDGAALTPESLRFLGLDALAGLVERANAKFEGGVPQDRGVRMAALDDLDGAWDEIDSAFYKLDIPDGGWGFVVGGRYVLEHPGEFFVME
jgi:hypothetical protein